MNYYKTKNKQKKVKNYFIYLLLLLVFASSFYLFKTKTSYMIYYMSYPYYYFDKLIRGFSSKQDLILENDKLKEENLSLRTVMIKNEEIETEIIMLKNLLNLKNIYSNYSIVNATVINRNTKNYFDEITIDKGSLDKIEKDMAVVTAKGLIGIIDKVYDKTSIVKLITNTTNNKISVGIKGKDGYHHGLISAYENNFLLVEGITNYDGVSLNSKVVTTGLGIFPSGIVVGYVSEVKNSSSMISKILKVSLTNDFDNIKYIAVLGNKIND